MYKNLIGTENILIFVLGAGHMEAFICAYIINGTIFIIFNYVNNN